MTTISASLLAGWNWVAALFGFEIALMFFGSKFMGDGLLVASLLFFGTIILGIARVHTNFLPQKTLLAVGFCTVFFLASM
ncbi:hypothetical protein [Microcoleus vaginatus]|uniref:hypothetical protein n=1 Tax=Microcoleus vaginatus TaxID=119532 RepID=UPI001682CE2A|nr:hypothetical protein [Microcoleus sp. FACHB-84]MBD2010861.1 hypothetical protein [Microcoleus sp. FACHB-45]